jgi:hypothetical protein
MGTIGTCSDWSFNPGSAEEASCPAFGAKRSPESLQTRWDNGWAVTDKLDDFGETDGIDTRADGTSGEGLAITGRARGQADV